MQIAGDPIYVPSPPDDFQAALGGSTRKFKVFAVGRFNVAAALTLTLRFRQVSESIIDARTASTLANDPVVYGYAATFGAAQSDNFSILLDLQWDGTNGRLNGIASGNIGGVLQALAAVADLTSISKLNDLNFILTATFSVANAANYIQLDKFHIPWDIT